jgi:hypothetical protein
MKIWPLRLVLQAVAGDARDPSSGSPTNDPPERRTTNDSESDARTADQGKAVK